MCRLSMLNSSSGTVAVILRKHILETRCYDGNSDTVCIADMTRNLQLGILQLRSSLLGINNLKNETIIRF